MPDTQLALITSPKDDSEIGKYDAERELALARADRERTQRESDKINLELMRRRFEWSDAGDMDNRVYRFDDMVTQKSCENCYDWLTRYHRMDPEAPVEIRLTTGGGSVWHGMALVDEILALREQGQKVIITVRGTAASMGAVLLQSATERVMGPSSTLMLHKLSTEAEGTLEQIEDMVEWGKIMQDQANELLASRSNLTKAQVARGMNRKDWSFSPQAALVCGLVDRIG